MQEIPPNRNTNISVPLRPNLPAWIVWDTLLIHMHSQHMLLLVINYYDTIVIFCCLLILNWILHYDFVGPISVILQFFWNQPIFGGSAVIVQWLYYISMCNGYKYWGIFYAISYVINLLLSKTDITERKNGSYENQIIVKCYTERV